VKILKEKPIKSIKIKAHLVPIGHKKSNKPKKIISK
jgi:hypothetical protein